MWKKSIISKLDTCVVDGRESYLYYEDNNLWYGMASFIDEDEIECDYCGHIGMWINGDFDVECPECGAEY